MTELLTAAQMRAIEQDAIQSGKVTGLELMERAGRGVVEAIFAEWPELEKTSHRAIVLCGPGNNGGDGFVIARMLQERGWEVEVFLYGDAEKLPPDAKVNYERWSAQGAVSPLANAPRDANNVDLIVDAVFGTGLGRSLSGEILEVISGYAEKGVHQAKTVAVDIPSGLCSDSGRVLASGTQSMPATLTVSFHTAKIGHYLGIGPVMSGKIIIADIGLQHLSSKDVVHLATPSRNELYKGVQNHKYTHGHALILSGGSGKTGAARLAARGALRIGAGLVTLGVPPSAQLEVANQITALMLKRVVSGVGDVDSLSLILQDERINALCLGPGMGVKRAGELLPTVLNSGRACVIDADALTALAQDAVLVEALHENCVLTPHAGEFARLFPDISEKLKALPDKGPAYSKVDATREAAKRAGCTVLFKGPDTVIAAPDGHCSINSAHYERSAPWLATAGSGDVLAGFIAGLLARGFTPLQAAETGAWLHVECALNFGPGLIAEDIPEQLPEVFRKLSF